ncbi:MAG: CAP domain-containing protein [Micromonosporaceae bacterium]
MYGRLSRIALFALLCTGIVVGSWMLVPPKSDRGIPSSGSPPGAEAGVQPSATPTEQRTGRASRNQRLQAAPSPSKPKPAPTTPRANPPLAGDAALEADVIELVNAERKKAGCGAVRYEVKLRTASRGHSADMAAHEELSHTGSDGSSPWDRAGRAGYDQAMSENIAMGYRTAEDVMEGWMNSQGHRDNILNCDAKAVGVGLARTGSGTPYWTQMFGRA